LVSQKQKTSSTSLSGHAVKNETKDKDNHSIQRCNQKMLQERT
jgi:hypothetical protein